METTEECLDHLTENYSNPNSAVAYLGVNKLYHFYNKILPINQIKKFLSTSESFTLMSPERKSKIYEQTFAVCPVDVLQMDLVEVSEMQNQNDNVKYLICAIDCYTRIAHAEGLQTKKSSEVAQAMSDLIFRYGRRPNVVAMDRGSEFCCAIVKNMLKKLGCKSIYAIGNYKCSMVERFQGTLQRLIYSHITQHQSLRYIDKLQELVRNYNTSYHRAIGMTPFEASRLQNRRKLKLHTLKYRSKQRIKKLPCKYDIGDVVRISLKKSAFHRSYNNQRTEARYIIYKICKKHVTPCYFLKNQKGQQMKDRFYEHELTLTNIPTYRSNVIKSKTVKGKTYHLVHYKGYSDDYDEWVQPNQLEKI